MAEASSTGPLWEDKIVCRRENSLTVSAVVTIVANAEKIRHAKAEGGGRRRIAAFG